MFNVKQMLPAALRRELASLKKKISGSGDYFLLYGWTKRKEEIEKELENRKALKQNLSSND